MPTRQTTTTTSPSSMPQTSNNNGGSGESRDKNFVLENASALNNYGRMRMPSGALRDVDELVNEIKLNLRLKSGGCSAGTGDHRRRCCDEHGGETAGSSVAAGDGAGGNRNGGSPEKASGVLSAGGKTKSINCRSLARIHSAPYHLHQCSEQEKSEGFQTFEAWQRRHHQLGPSATTHNNPDDPYVLLQELLQEGSLIKEAVRRINFVGEHQEEQGKCFDYEKDDYETSSQLFAFLPTV